MNSVTYSNVNFICTWFRWQTAVCVCAHKLQVFEMNTGVKTMSERTRDNGVTRCDTALLSHWGNRVFFHGDLYVHARKLLPLHRSNPTRSFHQLSGRRFFTLFKTGTGRRWNEEGRLGRFRNQISRRSRPSLVLWFMNQQHKLIFFFVFLVFFKKPGSVESVNIKTRMWLKWLASGLNIYADWEKNLGKLILKILWRLSLTSIHFI